ncbi:hypothetical protein V8E36_000692 [Tilletia maclaganii]
MSTSSNSNSKYPPPGFLYHSQQPRSHAASVSTASSLTRPDDDDDNNSSSSNSNDLNTPYRDDDHQRSTSRQKMTDDLDLEDPESLEDDVALLQKQRARSSSAASRSAWGNTHRGSARGSISRLLSRARGTIIVLSIVCAAFILVPLIQWLSSAPFASSPLGEALAAIPGLRNTSLYNLTIGHDGTTTDGPHENTAAAIPEIGTLTGHLPSASKYGASADTKEGAWGLGRARAAGFIPQLHIAGWADAATAARELNLTIFPGLDPAMPDAKLAPETSGDRLRQLTMDDVFDPMFTPARSDLAWAPEDPDEGVFSHVDPVTRDIILEDVTHARLNRTGKGKVAPGGGRVLYVKGDDVKDEEGNKLQWDSFKFSPNVRWVMFFSGRVKQWRHSSRSHVWLFDVATKRTIPVKAPDVGPEKGPTISFAQWISFPNDAPSPNDPNQPPGPAFAFVHKNDLYVSLEPTATPIRVTADGAESIFNGVPDWVYEEEVFSSDYALWPSPDGSHLAYLRFDEREVPIYQYPIYNPDLSTAGLTKPYVEKVKMKYPKPGFPNPVVSVHSIDLDALRKIEGTPSWQQVQAAKRVLVSPSKTTLPASISQKNKALNAESVARVDEALTGTADAVQSRLVTEVVWLTPSQVLIKESNRVSDKMRAVVFDVGAQAAGSDSDVLPPGEYAERRVVGKVVRSEDADARGGWIEPFQTVHSLRPRKETETGIYIDLAPTPDGFRHIARFDPQNSFEPVWLTSGAWEVDAIKFVDTERGIVYFTAAYPTPSQRHLFQTSLVAPRSGGTGGGLGSTAPSPPRPLTNLSKPGFYDASFDPKGAYYTLYDNGPGVPSQRVLGLGDDREHREFELVLEENVMLRATLGMYVRPSILYYSLEIDARNGSTGDRRDAAVGGGARVESGLAKVNISAREFRPHDFDASGRTRYPVLIYVYGGPNSQSVDASFARPDWHAYLASTLGYLVITLDARGTGFQGFAHRFAVSARLGEIEADDVVEAARKIAKLAYVDEKRVGIRGWSYGGYLTSKVIEKDSGVFSLGMAVAPVTKWEFYDTIYTERYMKTPALNPDGYEKSAVHVSDGFQHADFFLASGSADDNVHPTNIYHLLDSLTAAKIRRYEFRHFTDSDHSISTRGAFRELHEFMTAFLVKRWGAGGKRKPIKVPVRRFWNS